LIFYFPKTKIIGQVILFNLPGIKRLIQEIELARFGYLLGTLLKAGLPINQALDSLVQATTSYQYKKFYRRLAISIENGNSFQKSFLNYKRLKRLIPNPIQQLVFAGEQSGGLSKILLKISQIYEVKTETTTKDLSVILEPILLVIVWLGVVSVAMAVILPIYNLIGGFDTTYQVSDAETANVVQVVEDQPINLQSLDTTTDELIQVQGSSTPAVIETPAQTLIVLPNSLGYLNVRSQPSLAGEIIQRVLPGEAFDYIDQQSGWVEIVLPDQKTGWVSERYIQITQNNGN
ncbi:MAG: type II secretion system F family protein, partial [Candidatus Buchananbacteria bacterium]|nr:type II secretion system F family protein [Candidatus Buchananbacteria bacterium]